MMNFGVTCGLRCCMSLGIIEFKNGQMVKRKLDSLR